MFGCAAFNVTAMPGYGRQANTYGMVFSGILADSKNPAADLRALGLDPQLAKYAGTGAWSVIAGGLKNSVSAPGGFIGSGGYNTVSGTGAVIVGGFNSTAGGNFATIPGGFGDALSQVFGFGYPIYTFGLTLNLPIRNRSASANYADQVVSKRSDALTARRTVRQATCRITVLLGRSSQTTVSARAQTTGWTTL